MDNNELAIVQEEKDLGVLITNDLKASNQCVQACNKANRLLGTIHRTIIYKTKDVLISMTCHHRASGRRQQSPRRCSTPAGSISMSILFVNICRLCGMARRSVIQNVDFLTKQLITSLTGFQVTIVLFNCIIFCLQEQPEQP